MIFCLFVCISTRVLFWAQNVADNLLRIKLCESKSAVKMDNLLTGVWMTFINVSPSLFLAMAAGFNVYSWTFHFINIGASAKE